MLDIWGGEENDTNDNLSFEDSDRFEEDSLCSWSSEPESVCNNWRGWKKPSLSATTVFGPSKKSSDDVERVSPLCELAARCVASHIPFELVEHVYPPVPEQLQLRIAYWSFPDNEEDIRLYSCLANSSADEFQRGEHLYRSQAIKDPLQIGFHLSASVCAGLSTYNVAVTFDRRRITSCNCTCNSTAYWCSHIVAVCLHRIHEPTQVCLRAPVSESLSRLQRDQLQKFAQYLISELPQQILPTAQRLLDELLSSQPSAINSVCGAPDPTAGASANEQTSWYLDEKTLHDNIKKILIKFCVPAPIVFSDVNYLSNTAPPAAAEWTSLLRPLRGREPEGMWNLLSIVREMFKRNDRNALPLLEIITEECMACEQILVWWFYTKVALHAGYSGGGGGKHSSVNSNSQASQHACSSLCDEIVVLWRLAALNPATSPAQRNLLRNQFKDWHLKVIEKVTKRESLGVRQSGHSHNKLNPLEVFSGFKPAVEACFLDWDDYPLPGITYTSQSWLYQNQLFPCFRHNEPPRTGNEHPNINPVNSTQVVLDHHQRSHHHYHYHNPHLHHTTGGNKRLARNTSGTNRQDRHNQLYRLNLLSFMSHSQRQQQLVVGGNHSSVSSEGFCDGDIAPRPEHEETDSQGGGGSDSSWSSGREGEGEPEGEPVTPAKFMGYSGDDSDSSPPAHHPLPHPSPPRRLSKDDSLSSSNSDWQPSGDEFNVYYYDPKALENGGAGASGSGAGASGSGANAVANNVNGEVNGQPAPDDNQQPEPLPSDPKEAPAVTAQTVLQNIHGLEDPWEILFARAEGLHAHGHVREACTLGVRLAEEMLANPPDLMIEFPPILAKGKRKKQVNPASHQLSVIASNTLAKCGFLCQVLAENADYFNLAFKVGLFGLELARPPASTKPLEVKLANQESELVTLLKRIPLGEQELVMIRGRAHHLREGTLKSRGRALLPINLAGYILDALINTSVNRECRCQLINPNLRMPGDEMLGFEAAVAALGVKANVSEADHPLLCEGTRRQRGDLAITLLVLYKDDPHKLARIMDKLLDREVHQLIKSPVPYSFYSSNPPVRGQFLLSNRGGLMPRKELDLLPPPQQHPHAHQHHQYPHPHPHTHPHPYPQDGMIDASNMNGANSRPHSCTSAEFEQGLANLSLSSPGTSHVTPPITPSAQRLKETTSRFKGKRAYPSIPNQPSEAGAHFTFELAKTVLMKAGGNSSTSLFTQASTSQNHHGPHRALHMCAFQLGLYALGLHNCVSPNWLSRTYSSHVSWITGQAMEIGAPALTFMMDTWEGHLTPPEAVSIADRASRGCDPNMVAAAAQLALSCLPHAHALNPNEIQRAILQCKEQSDLMLEHSCLTVESAAKGGGVYPEVLFQVAKYWYELYMRHSPGNGEVYMETEPCPPQGVMEEPMAMAGGDVMVVGEPPPPPPHAHQPPPPYHSPPLATIAPYTLAPFGFTVQPLPAHFQLARHPHLAHQVYHLSPPTFQYPPHAANSQPAYASITQPPMQYYGVRSHGAGPHHVFPIAATMQPGTIAQAQLVLTQAPTTQCVTQAVPSPHQLSLPRPQPQQQAQLVLTQAPTTQCVTQAVPSPHQLSLPRPQPQQQVLRPGQQYSQTQFRYLLAAYRVGMLALDTLSRRVHDDRPQAKYARNPPYGEDVKWLLRVSKKLGSQYLHQLCMCAVNSIVSPFVLHDMALEAAHYLSPENHYCNNPGLVMQHLRTSLTPLVHKCQQMYIQCMHQKLYHLTTGDYEDFVNILCSARAAFQITPEGNAQFKEWLQSIRRSKSCKKDLWTQINAALQVNSK